MKKTEIIDTSKEVKKAMVSLSKKALREAGKVITKELRPKIPAKTGNLRKGVRSWAIVNYRTGKPEVMVGYLSAARMRKQYGIRYWVNPTWFEFGVKPHSIVAGIKRGGKTNAKFLTDGRHDFGKEVMHPGLPRKNLLRDTAYENIDAIVQAQKKYLSELNDLIITVGGTVPYENELEDETIDE